MGIGLVTPSQEHVGDAPAASQPSVHWSRLPQLVHAAAYRVAPSLGQAAVAWAAVTPDSPTVLERAALGAGAPVSRPPPRVWNSRRIPRVLASAPLLSRTGAQHADPGADQLGGHSGPGRDARLSAATPGGAVSGCGGAGTGPGWVDCQRTPRESSPHTGGTARALDISDLAWRARWTPAGNILVRRREDDTPPLWAPATERTTFTSSPTGPEAGHVAGAQKCQSAGEPRNWGAGDQRTPVTSHPSRPARCGGSVGYVGARQGSEVL